MDLRTHYGGPLRLDPLRSKPDQEQSQSTRPRRSAPAEQLGPRSAASCLRRRCRLWPRRRPRRGPAARGRAGGPQGRTGSAWRASVLACAALRLSVPWTARGCPTGRVDGPWTGYAGPPPTHTHPPPAHHPSSDPPRRPRAPPAASSSVWLSPRATSQSERDMDVPPRRRRRRRGAAMDGGGQAALRPKIRCRDIKNRRARKSLTQLGAKHRPAVLA